MWRRMANKSSERCRMGEVEGIGDLIYYQCAKIMARGVQADGDGCEWTAGCDPRRTGRGLNQGGGNVQHRMQKTECRLDPPWNWGLNMGSGNVERRGTANAQQQKGCLGRGKKV